MWYVTVCVYVYIYIYTYASIDFTVVLGSLPGIFLDPATLIGGVHPLAQTRLRLGHGQEVGLLNLWGSEPNERQTPNAPDTASNASRQSRQ